MSSLSEAVRAVVSPSYEKKEERQHNATVRKCSYFLEIPKLILSDIFNLAVGIGFMSTTGVMTVVLCRELFPRDVISINLGKD